ncbi:MAG: helix-turn-helix transcriptional regulator [Deltaproteobacteria bacterium]|nr:helix-turn-helix transcriptional regulator [Deltaproteobacteria bacterium]
MTDSSTPSQESKMDDENTRYPLEPSFFIGDIDTLKIFADPLRLRILRTLYEHGEGRALSAKQIRGKLGEEKNNRLYYHVRLLEEAGLIRKAFERKKRNLSEVFFVPVAKRLQIAPELFLQKSGEGETSPLVDMTVAYLGAVQADLCHVESAAPQEVILAHRMFSLSDEQAAEMRSEMKMLLEKYEKMPTSQNARHHRVTQLVYPVGD